MITLGWVDAPKALPTTPPGGLSVVRTPAVRTGPVPRTLAAVPDPDPGAGPGQDPGAGSGRDEDSDGRGTDGGFVHGGGFGDGGAPVVVLEALPGLVCPGDSTEFLVMAANPGPESLDGAWLGLLLPSGLEVSSVTPPAGTVAITSQTADGEVVRARLPGLVPGACVGLAVDVHLPQESGAYRLTAFLTPCDHAGRNLTCEHLVEVAAG